MFLMSYDEGIGWHEPRIDPYGSLSLDPAAATLHYAQAVFEGLKAFRGVDDKVRLFRPRKHIERLGNSMRRMCMPPIHPDQLLESLIMLLRLDQDWVPSGRGTSLYVRPTVIATEAFLGLRPAKSYLYYVILSPVGPYYSGELNPIKVLALNEYARAVPGGTGGVKTAGNYAGGLVAMEKAKAEGSDQVLWLDGRERKYIEEIGNMNIMFRLGDEVVTPPLADTVLPGVTRDSAITLLREWDIPVREAPISVSELFQACEAGLLREVWGTGTAGAICPISEISHAKRTISVPAPGELTTRLYNTILDIQYAKRADTHGWTLDVSES
jgi:branched-chain amino acid aminotransferase